MLSSIKLKCRPKWTQPYLTFSALSPYVATQVIWETNQGPVDESMVYANHSLRSKETSTFLWKLTLISAKRAWSNSGQVEPFLTSVHFLIHTFICIVQWPLGYRWNEVQLTKSMIFWKCTETVQLWTFWWFSELCINWETFLVRIIFDRYPNTNNIASITFDFPLPFGPTIDEKFCKEEQNTKLKAKFFWRKLSNLSRQKNVHKFIRIGYIWEAKDFNSLLYLMKWPQFLNSCVGLKVFIDYLCNH